MIGEVTVQPRLGLIQVDGFRPLDVSRDCFQLGHCFLDFLVCRLLRFRASQQNRDAAAVGIVNGLVKLDPPEITQTKTRRNDFGNVSVELWNNSYVAVSADIEGGAKFTRSPIIIDNRGKLLTISVVRRPIDPVVAIHLKLKVPVNAGVSGTSAQGEIKIDREAKFANMVDVIDGLDLARLTRFSLDKLTDEEKKEVEVL